MPTLAQLLRPTRISALGHLWLKSGLRDDGWFDSYRLQRPVDASGSPVPWYTYACIDFLGPRLSDRLRVFEYGSGNSTLWYAARAGSVVSVESDRAWVDELRPRCPDNVELVWQPDEGEYVRAASGRGSFDVVVIDGLEHIRPECLPSALEALAPAGVLVWDNSERDDFAREQARLAAAGFRELPFTGMGPINTYSWRTSVLYRDDNCLGI